MAAFMGGERLTVISKILKCPFGAFEAIQHRLRLSHEVRMRSKWKTGFLLVFMCVWLRVSPKGGVLAPWLGTICPSL